MQTFLTKWAIHFAEAIVALLIVMMIMRIAKRYRAQAANLQAPNSDKTMRPRDNKALIEEAFTESPTSNQDLSYEIATSSAPLSSKTKTNNPDPAVHKPQPSGSKDILDNYIDDFFG